MPGAPPVRLVSVAVTRVTPFCRNETVEPTTISFSWVPAASVPLGPATTGPLEQHQLRAAVVPEIQANVGVLPAVLRSHHRPDPLPIRQRRRAHLNLRILVTGIRLTGPDIPRGPRRRGPRRLLRSDHHAAIADIGPPRTQAPIRPVEIIRTRRGQGVL